MKTLIITNLYPNNAQKQKGVFNKQQFRELSQLCELRIIAPVPWVPRATKVKKWDTFTHVVKEEIIDGIRVYHPRYFVIPKIGRSLYGDFFYWGIRKTVKEIYKNFKFDNILATWAYPDAYGASLIAKQMKKPLIIKVHGTDINVICQSRIRRWLINKAMNDSTKIIAVSRALKEKIVSMGHALEKVELIPNGIDNEVFKKLDKSECLRKCNLSSQMKQVVYIGNLAHIKGVKYLIDAMQDVKSNVQLNIVGDGHLRNELESQVKTNRLTQRVNFVGRIPHEEIPYWLNAADVFCLPSLNEGCPNVILESLACQTPVVATRVGAIPDLVTKEQQGRLVEPANPKVLGEAINHVIGFNGNMILQIDQDVMSWRQNVQTLYDILQGTETHG